LDLNPDVESQLIARAEAEGTTASEYSARLLKQNGARRSADLPAERRPKRVSAMGKYAGILSSEEFIRRKQEEIDLEDRRRR
jgi:hypothetical protein